MENPLLLFPQLNISASKDKSYYKVMKSTIKEEPHKASKPGAKQKRNRLSLLLQKSEFQEGDRLGKPGNLTKAARLLQNTSVLSMLFCLVKFNEPCLSSYYLWDQDACFDQNCFYKPLLIVNTCRNCIKAQTRSLEPVKKWPRTTHCCTQVLEICEATGLMQFLKENQKFTLGVSKPSKEPLQHSVQLWTAVSPEEAVKWGESFDKLLSEKAGLDAFTKFLKTEFSEENIEFWIACEDYKKSKTAHELLPKAKTIYETFIQKDAPKEVNLDFQTKEVTSQNIEQPIITTFDAAQNTVYRLMEQDSYPRFLRSDPYLNLVKGRNPSRPTLRRRSRSFTVNDFQGV